MEKHGGRPGRLPACQGLVGSRGPAGAWGLRALLTAVLVCSVTACAALAPGSAPDPDRRTTVPSATAVPKGDVTLTLAFADAPATVDALAAASHKRHPNLTIEPRCTQFAVGMDDIAARGDILDLGPYRDAYRWRAEFPAASLDQLTGSGARAALGNHLYECRPDCR